MTEHLKWETLNDLADGVLAPSAQARAAAHLDQCAECGQTLAKLRSLVASATALPRVVDPPEEVWSAIRQRVEQGKVVSFQGVLPDRRNTRLQLMAAAVLLVVITSTITTMIVRREPGAVSPLGQLPGTIQVASTVPADFISVENGYLATVRELESAMHEAEGKLSPETVGVVKTSLIIIDAAILEARQALLADPASGVLRDILARSYQQKLDVLRRTTARNLGT